MEKIEETLESREVAAMIAKEHKMLMRDIRRYENQLAECKIVPGAFFQESTYKDANNQTRPCYQITKKGCEFIAHKLTGIKGTKFTAMYINRFHEMQEAVAGTRQQQELPWFIRKFRGRYIVLWRDFTTITGIDLQERKPKDWQKLIPGRDYNAWGCQCNNEEFKREYGFDYGNASCMAYFTLAGLKKVLECLKYETKIQLSVKAYETLVTGLNVVENPKKRIGKSDETVNQKQEEKKSLPVKMNICMEGHEITLTF